MGADSNMSQPSSERVWVSVRIRPLLEHEHGQKPAWCSATPSVLQCTAVPVGACEQQSTWTYDRVFAPESSSKEVYTSHTQGLVQSACAGLNAVVFAYGQTGAGKTYTMRALMQLAADDIFTHIQTNPAREFLLRMSAMEIYNEVVRDLLDNYAKDPTQNSNNNNNNNSNSIGRPQGSPSPQTATVISSNSRDTTPSGTQGPGLKIMEDPEQMERQQPTKAATTVASKQSEQCGKQKDSGANGNCQQAAIVLPRQHVWPREPLNSWQAKAGVVHAVDVHNQNLGGTWVEGLWEEGIESVSHLHQLLRDVEARRAVRDTRMNQGSSRSHQIVRITIESRPAGQLQPGNDSGVGPTRLSSITFVDLAGSERQSQAQDTENMEKEKLRQKEASSINRSLLTLGTVIRSLAAEGQARKHVPYRDSKLTRILQPSLNGNARMAIITTISPAAACVENSRAALHFANAAKRMIMTPQVNEIHDSKAVIKRLKAEIESLHRQMANGSWQEMLEAKEEQVRKAAEETAALQKRLTNLEKLILRSDGTPAYQRVRLSYDGSINLATPFRAQEDASIMPSPCKPLSLTPDNCQPGRNSRSRHPAASLVRASWNPSSNTSLVSPAPTAIGFGGPSSTAGNNAVQQSDVLQLQGPSGLSRPGSGLLGDNKVNACIQGLGQQAPSTLGHNNRWLLLDFFLPPNVRKAAGAAAAGAEMSQVQAPSRSTSKDLLQPIAITTVTAGRPAVPKLNFTKLAMQKLEAPKGADAEAALAALQAEVICISRIAAQTGELVGSLAPRIIPTAAAACGKDQDDYSKPLMSHRARQQQGTCPADQPASEHRPAQQPEIAHNDVACGLHAAVAHLQQELAAIEAVDEQVRASMPQGTDAAGAPCQAARTALSHALKAEIARLCSLRDAKTRAESALTALQTRLDKLTDDDHAADVNTVQARDSCSSDGAGDPSFNAIPGWMKKVYNAHASDGEQGLCHEASITLQPHAAKCHTSHPNRRYSDCGSETYDQHAMQHHQQKPEDSTELSNITQQGSVTVVTVVVPDDTTPDVMQTMHDSLDQSNPMLVASSTPSQNKAKTRRHKAGGQQGSYEADTQKDGKRLNHQHDQSEASITGLQQHPQDDVGSITQSLGSQLSHSFQPGQRVQRVVRDQRAEIQHWYKSELRRLQSEIAAANAADVAALRDVIEQYRETSDRLEVQKKLLLHQVLKLEMTLEEETAARQEQQVAVLQLTAERDQARFQVTQAKAAARAAAAVAARVQAHADNALADCEDSTPQTATAQMPSMFDCAGDDDWATQDTPEDTLLPRIMELWNELAVPLAYRSRFYLGFRNQELFYYELEHRRLEWKRSHVMAGGYKELAKAQKALEWERRNLAAALKYNLDDAGRESLFASWGIDASSKERKLQLINKVWHPSTVGQPEGALRSSQLVVSLTGTDAAEQLMQLVFGLPAGDNTYPAPPRPGLAGAVSSFVQRLTTPRTSRMRRSSLPTSGLGVASSSASHTSLCSQQCSASFGPLNSARSASSTQTTGTAPASKPPLTPRRSSFLSFMLRSKSGAVSIAAPAADGQRDSILSALHVRNSVAARHAE